MIFLHTVKYHTNKQELCYVELSNFFFSTILLGRIILTERGGDSPMVVEGRLLDDFLK